MRKITKKQALLAALALFVVVLVAAYFLTGQLRSPNDPKQVAIKLNKLDKEEDCNKTLEQLEAIPIDEITDKDGRRAVTIEKVYYYKMHCNTTLGDYYGAIAAANELKAYYEKNNNQQGKAQIEKTIESMKMSKKAEILDAEYEKNAPPPVENHGPLL